MNAERILATVELQRDGLHAHDRRVLRAGALSAALFRTPYGIEAIRLRNARGELVVLPWFGQMIWSMQFDGVDCTMSSGFDVPRPTDTIGGTYGCFAFHSGLLRNGVPGPEDDHAPHGEFPCAAMRDSRLEIVDRGSAGLALRLRSVRDHVVGFGPHYHAEPTVTIGEEMAVATIGMSVRNCSGRPMDLMYMCHVNWAFAPHARIVQPAPFTPDRVAVRRTVPAHVRPTDIYRARIEALGRDPAASRVLDGTISYDPEQVFTVHGLGVDPDGETALMLRRSEGDAFLMRYAPEMLPHCVRWLFDDPDQKVAAFALPATCEPEGHAAEKRKENVRVLEPGQDASFRVDVGHCSFDEAEHWEEWINALGQGNVR